MALIAWFNELRKTDVALAGGKGANLGELTAAGIEVPPGFVVTANAYHSVLEESGLGARIAAALEEHEASASIQRLFSELDIPGHLTGEIAAAYRALGSGPVAVRSSATAEDLAEASFAGQQSTYLNVEGEERLITAVRDCWASLYEDRAIAYRERQGFEQTEVKIAVVVQRMVQSERSGVMFTVNPVSGDPGQLVIEAVCGLGEAAVSGMVTPDMFVVDKATGAILQREIAEQEQQLVRDDTGTAGEEPNRWLPVPPELRRAQKLRDEEVAELAVLGQRLELHYGGPQDIEWARADGRFFILQSRPITSAGL